MSRAEVPTPLDELIFFPSARKNSYGMLSGGFSPKRVCKQAPDTSRAPPLVVWSFPAPSMVTPKRRHLAAHSSFQGSLPLPLKGDIFPWLPQPLAHFTRVGRQWYSTSLPS